MQTELVSLVIGGVAYTAWRSISIKYSSQSPERSFSVVASDEAPDYISNAWVFEPGTPVQVLASGELVLDGYINDLEINIEAESHELRVSGRSKSQDAVDCSVDHKTHEWRNKRLDEIANSTGNNTRFRLDESMPPIDVVRANPGEKVWKFIDRHARAHGLFLTGQADGSVLITKHGKKRHAGALMEGNNLKVGAAKFSDRERHEKIKGKSQRAVGTGRRATQINEEVTDPGARKGRVLQIMPDHHLDKKRARTRAEVSRDTRQGLSVSLSATIPGWRDDGGRIWEAGWLVYCLSTMLHLSQDLAINTVELSQDEGGSGTLAKLELVDPRALGGKGGKSKSAKGWSK